MQIDISAFERPDPALVARFAAIPASLLTSLGDGAAGLHHSIRRFSGSGIAIGTALTVEAPPGDNLAVQIALTEARPGDVIVMATGMGEDCAVVGDRVSGMASNAGVAAIVTDGLARDVVDLRRIALPVFARGLSPNGPRRDGPARIGGAVTLGTVTVMPGDLVIADDDGVAIMPRNALAGAAERLAAILDEERRMDEAIRAGASHAAWVVPLLDGARRT
jgi:regulator of RNase E activity RraA